MRIALPPGLIVAFALALAACATAPEELAPVEGLPPPPPIGGYAPFNAADFAWSTAPGSASIEGELAFRAQGRRYTCRGGDVILTPETPWSRRRMEILYGSPLAADVPVSVVRAREASGPRPDYARFVKKATCDDDDRFGFDSLPPGAWFVITLAKPISGAGEAVAVMRRVETRHGERDVTLN